MQITNELLERYASGRCTPDECKEIEIWLSDPQSDVSFPAGDISDHKNAIYTAIAERSFDEEQIKPDSFSYAFVSRWLAAAIFLLICGLGFFVYRKTNVHHLVANNREAGFRLIRTRAGEKTQVRLADGSLIYLNSESELRIPLAFEDSVRNVFLSGEAFLEVAKNPARPFIVTTSQAQVRVLGTRFNVQAYPGERETTVVVQEGKVQFSSLKTGQEKLILTKDERGIFNLKNGFREDNVYSSRYFGWKDNKLIFSDQKLSEIAPILERWYGVKIVFGSRQTGAHTFTGDFDNQSLSYVIEKLCYVVDLKYKIEDQKVTIY